MITRVRAVRMQVALSIRSIKKLLSYLDASGSVILRYLGPGQRIISHDVYLAFLFRTLAVSP